MPQPRTHHLVELYERWPYLFVLLLSTVYYLTFFNYGLDLDDEGFLLIGADSVLRGDWPIADFFSYQPLSYFVLAGFYQVFGNGVLAERIMLFGLLLLNIALLVHISRRLLPSPWSAVPALLYAMAPGPWYKVFFITHLITVMAVLIWYLDKPSRIRALAAGLVVGAAFISRYEAGVIGIGLALGTILALTLMPQIGRKEKPLSLIVEHLTHALLAIAGTLLVIGLTWLAYELAGKSANLLQALNDYYWHSQSGDIAKKMGILSRFDPVGLLTRASAEQWFYALGVIATLFLLLRDGVRFLRLRPTDSTSALRLLLGATALGSLAYSYLYVWNSRMLSTFPLVYVLWGILLLEIHRKIAVLGFQKLARWTPLVLAGLLSLAVVWFCRIQNYSGSITTRLSSMRSIDHPKLKGIKIYYTQVDDINNLMKELVDNPSATLISMSEATTMAYLAGKPNPTYYRLFTTDLGGIGEPDRLLEAIERHCITYFVARKSQFIEGEGLGSKLRIYAPRVRQHLIDNYRIKKLGRGFVLLTRKTACPPTITK